jgi:Mg-chelatase subunit ChlD
MKRVLAAAVSLVSMALAATLIAAQPDTTRLYVFASDRNGAAVEDLSASDFDVKENAAACRVIQVRHGNEAMRVVVLVDNSDAIAIDPLRKGLRELTSRIPADAEIGLVTIAGGGYELRVAPTLDRPRLEKSVNSLYGDGGGPRVAESLMQADAALFRDRAERWPVFVLVTGDSGVNTTAVKQVEFDAFTVHLQAVAASVHVVVLADAGNSQGARVLNALATNLTQNTGGLFAEISNTRALAETLARVGERIASDHKRMAAGYELEFVGAPPGPGMALEVGTARDGVTLLPSLRRVP